MWLTPLAVVNWVERLITGLDAAAVSGRITRSLHVSRITATSVPRGTHTAILIRLQSAYSERRLTHSLFTDPERIRAIADVILSQVGS